MESNVRQPLVCPRIIGRAPELAALDRLLGAARNGSGQVVLISGEAGIGKSRILAELTAMARASGLAVLSGHCFEPDQSVPYAPWFGMVRAAASPDDLTMSEILTRQPPSEESPGLDRPRQLIMLRRALESMHPQMITVEDVHWCDKASLDVFLDLARTIATQPRLLVLTLRPTANRPELTHFLSGLERTRSTTTLQLGRLQANHTAAMLEAMFDLARPVRRDFLDALDAMTEGNPLFVEETMSSLVATGAVFQKDGQWQRGNLGMIDIPVTVQDAIQRRLAALSAEARRAVDLAAVAGRRFDFTLLQELLGIGEVELLSIVRELIAAQLIVEESADRFAFRHALTQQALYGQLLARERRSLHRTVAVTLESNCTGPYDPIVHDLAHHFTEASEWDASLRFSRIAAERALGLGSPRIAFDHANQSMTALEALGRSPDLDLLRIRARAADTIGEFEVARVDYEAALALAITSRDTAMEWQTLLDFGLLWASRDYTRSGELLQQALDLARKWNDPLAIARSLNRVGNWRLNIGDPVGARREHIEALTSIEAGGNKAEIAATLDLLGMAEAHSGDAYRAIEYYRRAEETCRGIGDRAGLVSALAMLSQLNVADNRMYPCVIEPIVDPVMAASEAVELAREIDWRSGEAFALLGISLAAAMTGEIDRSLVAARQSLVLAEEIGHRMWACAAHESMAATLASLRLFAQAHEHSEQAKVLAAATGSVFFAGQVAVFSGWTNLLEGNIERAQLALDSVHPPHRPVYPFLRLLTGRLAVEIDLATGQSERALVTAEALIDEDRGRHGQPRSLPSLVLLRGRAERALGRLDDAVRSFETSRLEASRRPCRPLRLDIDLALSELYRERGDTVNAAARLDSARSLVDNLAMEASDLPDAALGGRSTRDLIRAAYASRFPATRPITALQASKRAFDGLTAREREVAALIAGGLSNRAIADELSVGERTVITHVTNILAKLGYSSRAQIAVWAVDRGLAAASRAE